jgi:hypothetical protein
MGQSSPAFLAIARFELRYAADFPVVPVQYQPVRDTEADAPGVVPPVFQPFQALQEHGWLRTGANVSENTAHGAVASLFTVRFRSLLAPGPGFATNYTAILVPSVSTRAYPAYRRATGCIRLTTAIVIQGRYVAL